MCSASRRGRWAATAAIALALGACGGDEAPPRAGTAASAADFAISGGNDVGVAETYAAQLGVDLSTMEHLTSGLYRRDLLIGEGQFATPGDRISIHYTGWLPDGTSFASSRETGPLELDLGGVESIPAWNEGITGMREGGRRMLVAPSDLGYPTERAPAGISPNSTLVFEIELLDIR